MNGSFTARALPPRRLDDDDEMDDDAADVEFPEVTFTFASATLDETFSAIFVHDMIAFAACESLESASALMCTVAVDGCTIYSVYKSTTANSLLFKILQKPDEGLATHIVRSLLEQFHITEVIVLDGLMAAKFCADRFFSYIL